MTEQLVRPVSAPSDAARLQRLAACRANNANREPLFDQIVADAARLIAVPVAVLGFLDADREWVKAAVGWNVISGYAGYVSAECFPWPKPDDAARLTIEAYRRDFATMP